MVILGVLVFFLGAMAIAGSNFGVLKFSFDVLGSILSPKAERIAAATGEPVITPASVRARADRRTSQRQAAAIAAEVGILESQASGIPFVGLPTQAGGEREGEIGGERERASERERE